MLVIIRPGFVDISIGVYMVLFSALLWSINIIITKKISKDDSAITILAYQSIFMSLLKLLYCFIFLGNAELKNIYLLNLSSYVWNSFTFNT